MPGQIVLQKILNTLNRFVMDFVSLVLRDYCFDNFYSLSFFLQLADFKLLQLEVGKPSEPGACNLTSCQFVRQSRKNVRVGSAHFNYILQQLSVKY